MNNIRILNIKLSSAMKRVKNGTVFFYEKLWKNGNTYAVYFLILLNIYLIKLYHLIICPANALKTWICWTELLDFSCNRTFDTCWKRNAKEVAQLTVYEHSCCGINDDTL